MANANFTPCQPIMKTRRQLSGAPEVTFDLWPAPGETFWVRYNGPADALIAAGIATPEMLTPAATKHRRLDANGEHFRVKRYFGSRDGLPVPRAAISWRLPRQRAVLLPGVTAALEAGVERAGWERQRLMLWAWEAIAAAGPMPEAPREPTQRPAYLHLVVNNTGAGGRP